MRILHKDRNGEGPSNRKGKDTLKTRRLKQLVGVSEWFRVDKGEPDAWDVMDPWVRRGKIGLKRRKVDNRFVEAVQVIPHTPNSDLKNQITKIESSLKNVTRFRFIEEMGRTVREMVVKKDPDPQDCGRYSCFTCQDKPGNCMRAGLVYKIMCKTCHAKGDKTVYLGETARTSWDRGF